MAMTRRAWLRSSGGVLLATGICNVRAQPTRAASDPGAAAAPSAAASASASASAASPQASAALKTLVVADFELVDDQNNPLTKAAQEIRLQRATAQLQAELAERGLYRVVDPAPSAPLQRALRAQQEYLYRCDDCAAQIGALMKVDLVMVTWVQKVSELILNLNVQVYDVARQEAVFSKSVDMRGNDDVSWRRAVTFLVRDMAEKRSRNPRYGL